MMTRAQLDAALDELARKLSPWREKLRHEAQFWPQFDALADELLAQAETHDLAHAQRRIVEMLAAHGLRRDAENS